MWAWTRALVAPRVVRPTARAHVRHSSSLRDEFQQQLPPMDKDTLKSTVTDAKTQCIKFKDEFVNSLTQNPMLNVEPYHVHKVFTFDSPAHLASWTVTSDTVHGRGSSTAELALTDNQRSCVFRGHLDMTAPQDGSRRADTGFCNILRRPEERSFHRDAKFDWSSHTHVEIKCRGDGRTYLLILGYKGYYDSHHNDIFCYPLHTRGGPYWQTTRVPFSKFLLMSDGCIQPKQEPLDTSEITSFGISAMKVPGHFQLELDYVGILYDQHFHEKSAYESYRIPVGIV